MMPWLQAGSVGQRDRRVSAVVTDPYFSSVKALLHFDGTNGSTTMTDVTGRSWSVDGAAALTTSSPIYGTASLNLTAAAGNGDIYTADAADLDLAGSDFTIEFFYKPVSVPGAAFDMLYAKGDSGSAGYMMFLYSGSIYCRNNATELVTPVAHGMSGGNTYHIAFGRTGGTNYVHIAGTQMSTGSAAVSDNAHELLIGAQRGAGHYCDGRLDEFRLTKGVCRYTASFTAPTGPFPDS